MEVDPEVAKHFEWARHKTRGELLDLVLDVEDRLRRWVGAVLEDCAAASAVTVQELVRESISSALQKSTPPSLDELTLSPLIDLVLNRWPLFERVLGERTAFRDSANTFRTWRNKLAHGQSPEADEKVEIAVALRNVGQRIPSQSGTVHVVSDVVQGAVVFWVDDRPEGNQRERAVFRMLGIRVVPVRSNDEAVEISRRLPRVDLVISDIDRAGAETGLELPGRLRSVGVEAPIIYYVGGSAPDREIPPHGHSIHDDPAQLLLAALTVLTTPQR